MNTGRLMIHRKIHRRVASVFLKIASAEEPLRVLIAVSGGMDSVLLAHHCRDLHKRFGWKFVVGHVNHGLRGEASDADEFFCRELAQELGFDFVSVKLSLGEEGVSESILRKARYAALKELRKKVRAEVIAIAHHANDQLETFLLRLVGGADLRGLGGMKPWRGKVWVRPLLDVTRTEIESEIKLSGIRFRHDESNSWTSYQRNFFRSQIIPLLQVHGNPQIVEHILELTTSFRDIASYLRVQSKRIIQRARLGDESYDVDSLARTHKALLRVALQAMFEEVSGGVSLARKHIYMLEAAIYKGHGNKILQLPGGLKARVNKKQLRWIKKREVLSER